MPPLRPGRKGATLIPEAYTRSLSRSPLAGRGQCRDTLTKAGSGRNLIMNEDLVAPCGLNCALCVSYQSREMDLNRRGFHRTYCPGCLPRGKGCLHMARSCGKLAKGEVRF